MRMEKILNETKEIVEEVCEKYGYDNQDTAERDSLKTVLLKAIPAMLQGHNYGDRQLFYQMLRHTPIVVTENLDQEKYESLIEQYIGKNINQHIIEEGLDLGEYGKRFGDGAYVSTPIFDENMNLQGKKSFIYIQKVTGRAKEFFGTDINVSHLIHELGHAWHAEKDQYTMQTDGTLKERVGTAEYIYSFSPSENNKILKKNVKKTGLMIEEGMNAIAEETKMANYMGIPLEQMRKEYKNTLINSDYQGYMSDFIEYMLSNLDKTVFENYRLYGKEEDKNKINALMEQTEYWKNRNTDILPSSESPRNYNDKRAIISSMDRKDVQDFFKKYESIYFPDISQITPLEKIDNVLEQFYSLKAIKYRIELDKYKDFLEILSYEGYPLVDQAADILELQRNSEQSQTPQIALSSALKNALEQGITTEQVNDAKKIEQLEVNRENEYTNEGVSIDEK